MQLNPFAFPTGPDLAHWPPDRTVYALRRPDPAGDSLRAGLLCEVAFESIRDAMQSLWAHPLVGPTPAVVKMTVLEYLIAHTREIPTESRTEQLARLEGLAEYGRHYGIDWREVAGEIAA